MGVYGASTFNQGEGATPPAQAPGATSSCTTTSTIGNSLAPSASPASVKTNSTTSSVRTRSLLPVWSTTRLSSPECFTVGHPHQHRAELRPYESSSVVERGPSWCAPARQGYFRTTCGGVGGCRSFPSLMNLVTHIFDDTSHHADSNVFWNGWT
jgi:hypothetical protein